MERLWNCLPEEVICILYGYLNFRDVEAASQTCKSWYEAFIYSNKIQNNVEFVIHRKHSEALMALSRHPSRCKRITIEDFDLEISETEWEQILERWKLFSPHVNHLSFRKCNIKERQFESFLCCCTSLVTLSLDDCSYFHPPGADSFCDLRNLASVSHLEMKDMSSVRRFDGNQSSVIIKRNAETTLMKLTNFMPNLVHLGLSPCYEGNLSSVRHIIEPKCSNIISLNLGCVDIDSLSIVCLLKVPDLRLKSLNLNYGGDGERLVEAIATHQTEITHLNIKTDLISREKFNLLCCHLKKLITFSFNDLLTDLSLGLESLMYLKQLKTLEIGLKYSYQSDRPMQIWFDEPLDIQLTHLEIDFEMVCLTASCNIDKECLQFITSRLLNLTFLNLKSCPLEDNLFREITSNLVNLASLKVKDCDITDDALTGLQEVGIDVARPPLSNLKRLTELDLSLNKVTDLSLKFAFKSCSLKKLSLQGCFEITDCGLMDLAAQPLQQFIEELNLSGCDNITDLGLSKLLPELKRLRFLNVEDCLGVTEKTLETVKKYCPKLRYLYVNYKLFFPAHKFSLSDALPLLRFSCKRTYFISDDSDDGPYEESESESESDDSDDGPYDDYYDYNRESSDSDYPYFAQ